MSDEVETMVLAEVATKLPPDWTVGLVPAAPGDDFALHFIAPDGRDAIIGYSMTRMSSALDAVPGGAEGIATVVGVIARQGVEAASAVPRPGER